MGRQGRESEARDLGEKGDLHRAVLTGNEHVASLEEEPVRGRRGCGSLGIARDESIERKGVHKRKVTG